jgi:hypothetical protein
MVVVAAQPDPRTFDEMVDLQPRAPGAKGNDFR